MNPTDNVASAAPSRTPAPQEPDPAALPALLDRRRAAAFLTRHYFPVSHRSLEAWPLPLRHVNGRALYQTTDLIAEAERRIAAAPVLMGGRRKNAATPARDST